MGYTRQKRQALISRLKAEREAVAKKNEELLQKRSQLIYQKIMRRLNAVNVTLWDVKLKDVLEVEREKKLKIRTLISDIQNLHKRTVHKQTQNTEQ